MTEDAILDMRRNLTDSAAAMALDHRARSIEAENTRNFSELGIIVNEVDERQLWRHVTKSDGEICHSWNDWVMDALPVSRSMAYAARTVAQRLSGIPAEERSLISPGNLRTLAEVDDPKITQSRPILDDAKTMKPAEFREKIAREHPEQHIENLKPMRFSPTESQRIAIEGALEAACIVFDEGLSREQSLEAIAAYYLDGHRELLVESRKSHKVRQGAIQ